jgi:hypothetical protein
MTEVKWVIPSQRKAKVEKFSTPVVTMSKVEKGSRRTFNFNKAAQEMLGIEMGVSHINFGYNDEGGIFIMCGTEETKHTLAVKKTTPSVTDQKHFEFISKLKNLDNTVENHMHLTDVDGQPYVAVTSITPEGAQITETSEEDGKEEVTLIEADGREETIEEALENAPEEVREGIEVDVVPAEEQDEPQAEPEANAEGEW